MSEREERLASVAEIRKSAEPSEKYSSHHITSPKRTFGGGLGFSKKGSLWVCRLKRTMERPMAAT